jgi:hypothetical protein
MRTMRRASPMLIGNTARSLCLGITAIAASASQVGACPTCRSALAEGGAHWAHGFALSIAVLLGVMITAGGAFGIAVWRATRPTT